MIMKLIDILTFVCLASLSSAAPVNQTWSSNCRDITIPITASANNTLYPPFPNSTLPGVVYQYLGSLPSNLPQHVVSGTFAIRATYCEPTVTVEGRQDIIQMFLHGVASTRSYWSGLGFPDPDFASEYSWISHANSQGYATLAVDNLGNGESARPDPLNTVQSFLQIEIMREIMLRLRSGSLTTISPKFSKVVFVTHSYGSILGRGLATLYPTDGANAYILTATSSNLTGINAAVDNFSARAASAVSGPRFESLAPGYLSVSTQGFRNAVYALAGDFDPRLLAWDLKLPHILAVGEIAGPISTAVSDFTGPVMVLTGRLDQIVCGGGDISAVIGHCGVGRTSNPDMTRTFFPKVSQFESYIPDKTGHDLNSHYSAPESFGAAHAWLTNVGF